MNYIPLGPRDIPPRNATQWQTLANTEEMTDRTIHNIELKSASKLQKRQYLMLRVLWKSFPKQKFDVNKFELTACVEEASRYLDAYSSWQLYCASFDGELSEGTFALARFYQKQVSWVPKDTPFDSDATAVPSPIAHRTRSRRGHSGKQVREEALQTPSKPPKNPQAQPRTPFTNVSSGGDSDEDGDEPPQSHDSLGPPELIDQSFPKTKDEQIVNTALLDFLNAFIIHRNSRVQWTLYRKPFTAQFATASIQARTDGCLEEVGSGKVHAIVEVKPVVRSTAPFSIAMQEAAQMVTWIKTNPDPAGKIGGCGHRLHVSQDRNEIYIIFAEYDETYVKYLDDKLDRSKDPGFLTMHQFGPWDIENRSDMADVGRILLAIALRADKICQERGKIK
ncbi:unnamed protein product [Penicillium salamii]|uniref:Uncharacterized protein n=1 Tax=Penicillium salamii TaxID=1612424 RepID=A0A9W4JL90_9EURO|nr:unnamed protein product [Penicillium salamii]CAG8050234.1 unnamed protein product [Penicillium salamii]CAG8164185.1 unnamed protein product [Penicillium salamii]CAG8177823.1 unnamed protein product [Penicillium salamii]CAG8207782.1 unnamed protein product [Penicillium salamii]